MISSIRFLFKILNNGKLDGFGTFNELSQNNTNFQKLLAVNQGKY